MEHTIMSVNTAPKATEPQLTLEDIKQGRLPENAKEVFQTNFFLVEDTPEQTAAAKEIVGNIKNTGDLQSALLALTEHNYEGVLTDLFYPVGGLKPEKAAEFYLRFGKALEDQIDPDLGKFSEIQNYLDMVKSGLADEVPSGILLALWSLLKRNTIPKIVTSLGHHNIKVEPVNLFLKTNYLSNGQAALISMFDNMKENGSKEWAAAAILAYRQRQGLKLKRAFNSTTGRAEESLITDEAYSKEIPQSLEELKTNSQFMNSELVKLALDLEMYFETKA